MDFIVYFHVWSCETTRARPRQLRRRYYGSRYVQTSYGSRDVCKRYSAYSFRAAYILAYVDMDFRYSEP